MSDSSVDMFTPQARFEADCRGVTRLAADMYQNAVEKGFHDGESIGPEAISLERIAIFMSNLHEECSELWSAARKGTLFHDCDKNCGLTNAAEELADIVIRTMDTAHSLGVDLGLAISKKAAYNKTGIASAKLIHLKVLLNAVSLVSIPRYSGKLSIIILPKQKPATPI